VTTLPPGVFRFVSYRTRNWTSFVGDHTPTSIVDLSGAPKLRDAVFRSGPLQIEWIITALRTVTRKTQGLQQISIFIHNMSIARIGGRIYQHWLDLDRLLVQLWESDSIRPKVIDATATLKDEQQMRVWFGCLLPEATKRGVVDLVGPNVRAL
jgi:hypothetical protein